MPYLSQQAHEAIRSTAWSGCYPLFAVVADAEPVCPECLRENLKLIVQATHDWEQGRRGDPQWAVVAYKVNWEDMHMVCSHCSDWITSAYEEQP